MADAPRNIEITTHDGKTMNGYVARPDPDRANGAGVLVLHEISGLDHNAQQKADRFALDGYVALAPDLYGVCGKFCVLRASMWGGAGSPVYGYLADARTHLQGLLGEGGRIGVAGFCMGGRFAVMLAGHDPEVAASAPYYGMVPWFPDRRLGETCPVFGRWGGRDWMFRWSGKRLEKHLAGMPESDVQVISGAGHGFMNRTAGQAFPYSLPPLFLRYDEAHAEQSWCDMRDFFEMHLVGNAD